MHEIVANVYRGEGLESAHHGAIAVVNDKKELTHYLGDVEFFTQARSEAKPFQIIPLIKSGIADKYGFSDKQLAIMCGSHTGTDEHVEVVLSNLKQSGLSESDLKCGTHQPFYLKEQNIRPNAEDKFIPAQHNCSGKHSGFLALTKEIGGDIKDYLNPDTEIQQMILTAISETYGYPRDDIKIGIDGCSAPVFGMPLKHAAIAYATLANGLSDDPEMKMVLNRIKKIMTDYPEMISGEGRFDLALARTFPGNVVNKIGAEGIEGIGFSEPAIGIAVKIIDGSARALYPVVIEVLHQLGILENVDMTYLEPFAHPVVYNYRKMEVGRIVPEFELKSV